MSTQSRVVWPTDQTAPLTCPACLGESSNATVLATAVEWDGDFLVTCGNCGTVSWNERREADYSVPWTSGISWFRLEHAESMESLIATLTPVRAAAAHVGEQPRLADVGCGTGMAADFAATHLGWNVTGFDPSPAAIFSRDNVAMPIRQELFTADTRTDDGARYQLVLCSEVLEHLVDIDSFLAEVRDGMADNGYLVLTTPPAAILRPETDESTFFAVLGRGEHVHYFTPTGLRAALERAGYRLDSIWSQGSHQVAIAARGDVPHLSITPPAVDVSELQQYLEKRWAAGPEPAASRVFGSRLIRSYVDTGKWAQAQAAWTKLAAQYENVMNSPLTSQTLHDACPTVAAKGYDCCTELPANLASLAFNRGRMLAHAGESDQARAWFTASIALTEAWHQWYDTFAPTAGRDGELSTLATRARHQRELIGRSRASTAINQLVFELQQAWIRNPTPTEFVRAASRRVRSITGRSHSVS